MNYQNNAKTIYAVGIGPGTAGSLTEEARAAICKADVIVGYKTYCQQISYLLQGQQVDSSGMRSEVKRCTAAIDYAVAGNRVALISSGDAGVYGMAGLLLELLDQRPEAQAVGVQVIPGITAALTAASVLGAPLMNDFAVISLSDILTPREDIVARLTSLSQADIVCALYNPCSRTRSELFTKAVNLFIEHRGGEQSCGLVKHAGRQKQNTWIGDLGDLPTEEVDMSTVVIIGNSQTEVLSTGHLVTRRGYATPHNDYGEK